MIFSFPFIKYSEIYLVSFGGWNTRCGHHHGPRSGWGTMDSEAWRVGDMQDPEPLRDGWSPRARKLSLIFFSLDDG